MSVYTLNGDGFTYAILDSFALDRDEPTEEHRAWFRGPGRSFLSGNAWVHVMGTADRSGGRTARGRDHNFDLGRRRAGNVADLIAATLLTRAPQMYFFSAGQTLARGPADRWPADRYAAIARLVTPSARLVEPPERLNWNYVPAPTTRFYIRVLSTISVNGSVSLGIASASAGIIDMVLQISDGAFTQAFNVRMPNVGGSLALGPSSPIPGDAGGSLVGPWYLFRVATPRTVASFGEGTGARLVQASAGIDLPRPVAALPTSGSTITLQLRNPDVTIRNLDLGTSASSASITAQVSLNASATPLVPLRAQGRPTLGPGVFLGGAMGGGPTIDEQMALESLTGGVVGPAQPPPGSVRRPAW